MPVTSRPDHAPLLSPRFVAAAVVTVAAMALLSLVINVLGNLYGQQLIETEDTASAVPINVTIGPDRLVLPANTVRFAEQRRDGPRERLDLYLKWPTMTGFTLEDRASFQDIRRADDLIFLQISQSTMSRDMSGRVEPIYSRLYLGPAETAPHGLTLHRLRPESGYGDEALFTARRSDGRNYAVRCMLRGEDEPPSSGDCQRDIHLGRDLTVLYRFSGRRLHDWEALDRAVEAYVFGRITAAENKAPQG